MRLLNKNIISKVKTMWRMYIKLGIKEDFLEFDSMEEAIRLADKVKKAYPWYVVKLRRVPTCG